MDLLLSNIAWREDEETRVAEYLRDVGIKYVEIAPTKRWNNPPDAPSEEVLRYRDWWAAYGIEVYAFQSMLYNLPDLKIFSNQSAMDEAERYLSGFIALAGDMGAKRMVFGSPKNRMLDGMDLDEANERFRALLTKLGVVAQSNDVLFCVEPNASAYGCDFITNSAEGARVVDGIDGIALHLDTACMYMEGESIQESILAHSSKLEHFHVSAPYLSDVNRSVDIDYRGALDALKKVHYSGKVSIEMKPMDGDNVARVRDAVEYISECL